MGKGWLRQIQRSGISRARAILAKVSLYIKGPLQIKAHLSGANKLPSLWRRAAKFRHTKPLDVGHCKEDAAFRRHALHSPVACCLLLSALTRAENITGSKSFQAFLHTVQRLPLHLPPPLHSTILSSLKQSKLDASRSHWPQALCPKMSLEFVQSKSTVEWAVGLIEHGSLSPQVGSC